MSKERQNARAERERLAAERAAAGRAAQQRSAADRARREERELVWRRIRLWQHGTGFHRNRERWGGLATLVLLLLLLVWLFSRSWTDVFVTVLAMVICLPVLVLLFVDRKKR